MLKEHSSNSPNGRRSTIFKSLIPVVGGLMVLQGLAEVARCIVALRTGEWPARRLHEVEETEKLILGTGEAAKAEKSLMTFLGLTNPELGVLMLGLFVVFIMLGFPIAFTLMGWASASATSPWATRCSRGRAARLFGHGQRRARRHPAFVFMGYIIERANISIDCSSRSSCDRLDAGVARGRDTRHLRHLRHRHRHRRRGGGDMMGLLAYPAMLAPDTTPALGRVVCAGGCLGIYPAPR